jgi:ribulose-phosphate 3-epimerase
VNRQNLADVVRSGCEWIVTGSAIFHTPDPEATAREMREIAAAATGVIV